MEEIFFAISYLSYYVYEIIILTISSLALKKLWYKYFRKTNLPPGPWCPPIVGYLPFLNNLPHLTFNELAKKYGPVFGLNIGLRYCVVLNDFESVKEAFQKDVFNDRAPGTFELPSKNPNIGQVSGTVWKEHKKLFANFTRLISKSESKEKSILENIIIREVQRFMSKVEEAKDNPINIQTELDEFMYKVVFTYLLGKDITEDDPGIIEHLVGQHGCMLQLGTVNALTPSFYAFRCLTRLWEPMRDEYKRHTASVENVLRKVIDGHKLELNPDNPKDYIDHYLIEQERNPGDMYSNAMLIGNLQGYLAGGTHTVKTTLEWLFILLSNYPDVQDKIYLEIESTLSDDQTPTWENRNYFPYTYATILESIRLYTLAPVNTPRYTSEDTSVMGYNIPKRTVVYANNWQINHDDRYWKEPFKFIPDRFLEGQDGQLKIKSTERLISFSYGRRECPGRVQSMMQVLLFLTNVIQKFKVSPLTTQEPVLEETFYTMLMVPAKPYVKFEKR